MINNVTVSNEQKNHTNEGHCPAWCAAHSRVDVGHRDEAISHDSATVTWVGHTLRVNRWAQIDGGPVEDTIWLDEEMISPAEAKTLAGLLLARVDLLDDER